MAHETGPKDTVRRLGMYGEAKVAANTTIYAGTMVGIKINSGEGTAYAVNAQDTTDLVFAGVAMETAVCGATAGAVTVKYWKEGEFNMKSSSLTKSDTGKLAYVAFDGTVSLAGGTNSVLAGYITEVASATECWIMINSYGISNFGGAASMDVGTEAGTVAAGDHTHA